MKKLHRVQIGEGVHFSWYKDPKFKHNQISIRAFLPLDHTTVSHNAMIPLLLRKGSASMKSETQVHRELNHLYGATLSGGVSRYNKYQSVILYMRSLDNRYAMEGEDLITASVNLLLDCYLNPAFNRNFSIEKQYLKDMILRELNDKRGYAISRGLESMFKDELIATPLYGTLETAEEVTPQSVEAAWNNMIKTAPVEIFFTGSGEPSLALEAFKKAFAHIDRQSVLMDYLKIKESVPQVTDKEEELVGLQQGKLVMGFRSKALVTKADKDAARLFSALFGGTPFSKLFLNVREKLSLAYYCASRMDTVNGYLLVDSGVDQSNKEKTQAEVLAQLKEMKQGNFSKDDLDKTKLLLANAVENTEDSLGALEEWYLAQILLGQDFSPKEDVAQLNKVTLEDVTRISQGISLDTIYFLTGKEG